MPGTVPFVQSQTNYDLLITLDAEVFVFTPKWNSQDGAWYLDITEEDQTPIITGAKLVLGKVGRTSTHPFFQARTLDVVDTSDANTDAGFDDLGVRVQLQITSVSEVLSP